MPEIEIEGLTISDGQFLTVPVEIEKSPDTYLFLVSTGELRCSLLPRIIDRLKDSLDIEPVGVTISPTGREVWYHLTIEVGRLRKDHVAVVARELPTWIGADGVLGMNWFRFIEPKIDRITLDLEAQTLGMDFT